MSCTASVNGSVLLSPLQTMVTPLTQKFFGYGELENSIMYCLCSIEVIAGFLFVRWLSRCVAERVVLAIGLAICNVSGVWCLIFMAKPIGSNVTLWLALTGWICARKGQMCWNVGQFIDFPLWFVQVTSHGRWLSSSSECFCRFWVCRLWRWRRSRSSPRLLRRKRKVRMGSTRPGSGSPRHGGYVPSS